MSPYLNLSDASIVDVPHCSGTIIVAVPHFLSISIVTVPHFSGWGVVTVPHFGGIVTVPHFSGTMIVTVPHFSGWGVVTVPHFLEVVTAPLFSGLVTAPLLLSICLPTYFFFGPKTSLADVLSPQFIFLPEAPLGKNGWHKFCIFLAPKCSVLGIYLQVSKIG